MNDTLPGTIYLENYEPSAYLINRTELHFDLYEDHVIVSSLIHLFRVSSSAPDTSLALNGEDMELLSVSMDGRELDEKEYSVSVDSLVLHAVPEQCVLSCKTRIRPQENTSLSGLYKSRSLFCTQCEAEGFRKITYYLDRPDVMSVFTVTVQEERDMSVIQCCSAMAILLKQQIACRGAASDVVWHDPFPKPAYLFALVAGNLEHIESQLHDSK